MTEDESWSERGDDDIGQLKSLSGLVPAVHHATCEMVGALGLCHGIV
jgi:hypothetical protein